MPNCESCPSKGGCNKQNTCGIEFNPLNKIKHVIGVMSGKGGVGKSTISSLIASELNTRGYKVGILDADITGPSIPRLFGITGKQVFMDESGIQTVKSDSGISVMSMNLLTNYEEQAVIWRGPMIAGAVKQFWTDVIWGELDFLVVDMPPGTGDVALTVMQSLPLTGIVMVSTPQDMVSMIVAKAVNMAQKMNINVFGVVENMSYITCPECTHKIEIFGDNAASAAADKVGTELLGELPMDTELMKLSNFGKLDEYEKANSSFKSVVDRILEKIN